MNKSKIITFMFMMIMGSLQINAMNSDIFAPITFKPTYPSYSEESLLLGVFFPKYRTAVIYDPFERSGTNYVFLYAEADIADNYDNAITPKGSEYLGYFYTTNPIYYGSTTIAPAVNFKKTNTPEEKILMKIYGIPANPVLKTYNMNR